MPHFHDPTFRTSTTIFIWKSKLCQGPRCQNDEAILEKQLLRCLCWEAQATAGGARNSHPFFSEPFKPSCHILSYLVISCLRLFLLNASYSQLVTSVSRTGDWLCSEATLDLHGLISRYDILKSMVFRMKSVGRSLAPYGLPILIKLQHLRLWQLIGEWCICAPLDKMKLVSKLKKAFDKTGSEVGSMNFDHAMSAGHPRPCPNIEAEILSAFPRWSDLAMHALLEDAGLHDWTDLSILSAWEALETECPSNPFNHSSPHFVVVLFLQRSNSRLMSACAFIFWQ